MAVLFYHKFQLTECDATPASCISRNCAHERLEVGVHIHLKPGSFCMSRKNSEFSISSVFGRDFFCVSRFSLTNMPYVSSGIFFCKSITLICCSNKPNDMAFLLQTLIRTDNARVRILISYCRNIDVLLVQLLDIYLIKSFLRTKITQVFFGSSQSILTQNSMRRSRKC